MSEIRERVDEPRNSQGLPTIGDEKNRPAAVSRQLPDEALKDFPRSYFDDVNAHEPNVDDRPSRRPAGFDAMTLHLGSWYVTDERFDWCRNGRGYKHRFSRWYPERRLLVDVFPVDNGAAHAEAEDKARIIRERNASNKNDKYGYLPLIAGDQPTPEVLAQVVTGVVHDLPERVRGV